MNTEIFTTADGKNIIKQVTGHPIAKTFFVTVTVVAFIFFAGKLMQILTKMVLAFKNLSTALKMPTTPPKLAA